MKIAPRPFFIASAFVTAATALISGWHFLSERQVDELSCATKAIMRFEGMQYENINANVHFNFREQGKGSLIVEGYTHSASGSLYLQRYVSFNYSSQRISPAERHYRIVQWQASASSIDESPDVIFDYFMREMSDSHDGLFLSVQKLNDKAVLIGSINSPLFVCTLKPGNKLS
ncbi:MULTISPECIES: FidL-like protein [Pantoea]|uniref:FidL-like putative membrane protein n=1 Tax=Candidatus Pantoea floridensis TaxID=1938870 RepID=A0A286BWA6_9GAMM|nr:FidL-like protein [Pantoea floridensis]PIF20914.1 FidL-like putative membrane protein [Enterobacteriaceae bacterium JKS000233]SOD38430.1 FidL-like putative membrane protein [Pantoea floridensis]HBZ15737.1 hypothetical protein [Pantoea sp.]